MLGQSFYHETIRNVIVAFGTMFNNIQIVRKDNSGTVTQIMKVPLAYGPKQKFLTRLDQDPSLSKNIVEEKSYIASSVIKTVQVDQYANLPEVSPTREQRYSVTPKPITADADDDFGFNETSSFFVDAKNFDPETGTDKLKQGNTS